jgi:hypothetical protein
MKDLSKPDGEAVNADGSLKDAHEIKWLNSPTDELRPPILGPNEDLGDATELGEMQENEDFDIDMYEDMYGDINEDENLKVDEERGEHEEGEEGKNEEEDKNDATSGEEEDVDEEAVKRYWEAKAKEGIRKVCLVILEAVDNINKFTQPKKKSQATRDIQLSFQYDTRLVDGVLKAGGYCRWCL